MESGTKILLLAVLYTSLYVVAVTVLDGTKSLFVITAGGGGNSSPSGITTANK